MRNDLLILLSGLDRNKMKRLGKFVNSPYFNNNSKASELFELLKDFHPEFASEILTKQYLHKKLYGREKFVEGTINYLISELQALAERFISLENLDDELLDLSYLEFLSKGGFGRLFYKNFNFVEKNIARSGNSLYEFRLSDILSHQLDREKSHVTRKDHYRKEWFEPTKKLIIFFLDAILTEMILLSNYKRTVNTTIEIPLLAEVLKFVENNPSYLDDIRSRLNYHLLKVIVFFDNKSYIASKELILKKHRLFSGAKISEALNAFQIFCSHKLLRGEDFRREEFEIAKLRLKVIPYTDEGSFGIDIFYKTFMLAVSVGEFEWVENFVRKYSGLVSEKFRNNAVHYSWARIFYQKKQYDKALTELSRISSFSFIHYKPAVKILQMMIYFDTMHWSEAGDSANAFTQFLRQDRLTTEDHKKAYQKFIRYFLILLRATSSGNIEKLKDAKMKVESAKGFLIGKKWLTEKLAVDINKK